ncbi:hypothetical protein [Haloarcula sp. Atlit-7R]|uniref:hypothetical protein n=1 Tax=Haloarcula sp. Atlit-7R TaxID=2282125 RepID=UPI000EF1610A|nr:hypothetical protein [Haloarcula sp. Atlit-7R]RLM94392.1 hypothetical protein D3D01_16140 [Haloarcula sp. Atlit-7R]
MTESEQTKSDRTVLAGVDESNYYRVKDVAAPDVGNAEYFNHPKLGWCPVLDILTDIETDSVVIAFGDSETGAFAGILKTYYSEYADIITSSEKAAQFIRNYPDAQIEDAESLVEDLPAETPGARNV